MKFSVSQHGLSVFLTSNHNFGVVKMQKNATILTVVGKTFDELVLNSPKNILLEVRTTLHASIF